MVESMMASVVDLVKNTGEDGKKKRVVTKDDMILENCPLTELFGLIEQYKKY